MEIRSSNARACNSTASTFSGNSTHNTNPPWGRETRTPGGKTFGDGLSHPGDLFRVGAAQQPEVPVVAAVAQKSASASCGAPGAASVLPNFSCLITS